MTTTPSSGSATPLLPCKYHAAFVQSCHGCCYTSLFGRASPAAAPREHMASLEPNNDEVICPNCTHQFRAIPVNVQRLLLSLGAEPPFAAAPREGREELLREAHKALLYALPYLQQDASGNGPDCTPVFQALIDLGAALGEATNE